jgi:hypothetical protein
MPVPERIELRGAAEREFALAVARPSQGRSAQTPGLPSGWSGNQAAVIPMGVIRQREVHRAAGVIGRASPALRPRRASRMRPRLPRFARAAGRSPLWSLPATPESGR